ncbi:MAG TPA: hypothetical protein VF730_12335 [Terracidiphilus sp.]
MNGTLDLIGFVALLWGALGVQWAKHLEVGSRRRPREEPNPYFELVRFLSALVFLSGLGMILWGAWMLLR